MAESLRDVRLFVAAYEERSFTAAAIREHATQSGVSQHIRKVEDRFDVSLFIRDTAGVVPTPAGDRYYRDCIEILRAHATASRSVSSFGKGIEGAINIGLMPTMTRCVLAPSLARFIDQHPNCAVRVVEGYSGTLTAQVQSGELDFAIVPAFPGAMGLRSHLFIRTAEVLVSAKDSPLNHGEPVRLRDVRSLKVVVPSKANTRRNLIETYLSSNGIHIERLLELDAMMGTLDFVAQTNWMSILPGLLMSDQERSFTVNPISDPPFGLDLILIEPSRTVVSRPASAFLDFLREESERFNVRWSPPQT